MANDPGITREEFMQATHEAAVSFGKMMRLYAENGPVAKLLETGEIDTAAFARNGCIVTELDARYHGEQP